MTTENQQNRVAIIVVTTLLLVFFIGCAVVGVILGPVPGGG